MFLLSQVGTTNARARKINSKRTRWMGALSACRSFRLGSRRVGAGGVGVCGPSSTAHLWECTTRLALWDKAQTTNSADISALHVFAITGWNNKRMCKFRSCYHRLEEQTHALTFAQISFLLSRVGCNKNTCKTKQEQENTDNTRTHSQHTQFKT